MATQSVEDFVVRVDPESRLNQHLDYFGTTVIEFGISRPHEHMSIDVRARVRTSAPDEPPPARCPPVATRPAHTSVTRTATVRVVGPSNAAAENVAVTPVASALNVTPS